MGQINVIKTDAEGKPITDEDNQPVIIEVDGHKAYELVRRFDKYSMHICYEVESYSSEYLKEGRRAGPLELSFARVAKLKRDGTLGAEQGNKALIKLVEPYVAQWQRLTK